MKHLIGMTSITYAVKAQEMLKRHGIRVQVVSTPKNTGSGCGYSLQFTDPVERVVGLLRDNGIKFKEVYR